MLEIISINDLPFLKNKNLLKYKFKIVNKIFFINITSNGGDPVAKA
jgi:hypothetical protein